MDFMERMKKNGTKAEPRSKSIVWGTAESLKRMLGFNTTGGIDVIKMVETLEDYGYTLDVVGDEELDKETYATTEVVTKVITIKESVYDGAVDGNSRHRFTIAHEIGHAILHTNKIILCRADETPKAYEDPEWQANQFAGELLMPLKGIRGKSIEEIADEFGVSRTAALIRVKAIS